MDRLRRGNELVRLPSSGSSPNLQCTPLLLTAPLLLNRLFQAGSPPEGRAKTSVAAPCSCASVPSVRRGHGQRPQWPRVPPQREYSQFPPPPVSGPST